MPDKFFIEIGSNSYDTLHDLLDNGWKGIMVEPDPLVAEKIEPHPNLTIVQAAIAESPGEATFYRCSQDGWSSLIADHHLKNSGEVTISTIQVPAITFDGLVEKYVPNGVYKIDHLKIDAEGYDAIILLSIDLSSYDIRCIQFEHEHLKEHEILRLCDKLKMSGYFLVCASSSNLIFEKQWE